MLNGVAVAASIATRNQTLATGAQRPSPRRGFKSSHSDQNAEIISDFSVFLFIFLPFRGLLIFNTKRRNQECRIGIILLCGGVFIVAAAVAIKSVAIAVLGMAVFVAGIIVAASLSKNNFALRNQNSNNISYDMARAKVTIKRFAEGNFVYFLVDHYSVPVHKL